MVGGHSRLPRHVSHHLRRQRARPSGRHARNAVPLHISELKRLGSTYWIVVAIAVVFTLARFSEAFLILRAQSEGLAVALVPAVLVLMNLLYALSSYPAGVLSTTAAGRMFWRLACSCSFAADLVLALFPGLVGVAGVLGCGPAHGFSQGLLPALIADTSPPELRGTAFGMLNFAMGVALLAASIIAVRFGMRSDHKPRFLAGAGVRGCRVLRTGCVARPSSDVSGVLTGVGAFQFERDRAGWACQRPVCLLNSWRSNCSDATNSLTIEVGILL